MNTKESLTTHTHMTMGQVRGMTATLSDEECGSDSDSSGESTSSGDSSSEDEEEGNDDFSIVWEQDSQNFTSTSSFKRNKSSSNDNLDSSRNEKSLRRKIRYLYIQMEYCEGSTLRQLIDSKQLVGNRDHTWKLFRQVCDALEYIHSEQVLHRGARSPLP